MQELHHENVLGLLDVFGQQSDISLVFDFMITDLEALIKVSTVLYEWNKKIDNSESACIKT